MNHTSFGKTFSRYWNQLQCELLPMKHEDVKVMTPTLEKIIRTLEWVRVEEHVGASMGFGRPPHARCTLARAFCAKAILGLECTRDLIERLKVDGALRQICGFVRWRKLPSESTFSRAFEEFANEGLADKAHTALIKATLGEHIIGSVSRDSTAIIARERPAKVCPSAQTPGQAQVKRRRGRPAKGAAPVVVQPKRVEIQREQSLEQMLAELPKNCAHASKVNAKGYKESWNGYKLHLDTAECGVIVSALTTAASVHDSQVCIPLSRMSEERITFLYELCDAAYCSIDLREDSIARGHVPLFDHNPRGGEKKAFEPHEAQRYKQRTSAERSNAELKDNFGLRQMWLKGHTKVHASLMFAVLCVSADQLMRLLQ